MLWFCADTHFGHSRIAAFSGRPFGADEDEIERMNLDMVRRWNEQVAPEDSVWFLGDACLGRIDHTLGFISLLNGTIDCVVGNHDRPFGFENPEALKAQLWVQRYLDAGFASLHASAEIEIDGETVLLNHFPYAGDSHGEDRYSDQRPTDEGLWLLHGHVHEAWRQRGRMINVGIDSHGGHLISIDQVRGLIAAGERDLDRLPWDSDVWPWP